MEIEPVVDAAEFLLAELTDRDEVAHAEAGGVTADCSDAVVTTDGIRSTTSFTTTGVWWRLFADGAADYRFSSSLEEEHLQEIIDRSVRSATLLGQEQPARFDPETVHRATHPGWGDGSLADQSVDEAADDLYDALNVTLDGLEVDRARVEYTTRAERAVILTTTGTTLRTTLERASARGTIAPAAGGKVRGHYGETTGAAFLESVPEHLDSLAQRARRVAAHESSAAPEGRHSVVFAPAAAAALLAAFSAYLELDTAYIGSSPFESGDRFGPAGLTIEDSVRPGSWAACAFDAEGRPAHPTTLVDDGVVNTLVADTAGAAAEETHPSGNLIPSLGWEEPPRIHARHLDAAAGDTSEERLRGEAAVEIDRLGPPEFDNEATRTKRESGMPPSTPYAEDIASQTPSAFADEATDQRIRFPVREGYRLDDGERVARLPGAEVVIGIDDFRAIEAMGAVRGTATGTHEKHGSTVPWAATAPAMLVTARLTDR
jgi:TldD protein